MDDRGGSFLTFFVLLGVALFVGVPLAYLIRNLSPDYGLLYAIIIIISSPWL